MKKFTNNILTKDQYRAAKNAKKRKGKK